MVFLGLSWGELAAQSYPHVPRSPTASVCSSMATSPSVGGRPPHSEAFHISVNMTLFYFLYRLNLSHPSCILPSLCTPNSSAAAIPSYHPSSIIIRTMRFFSSTLFPVLILSHFTLASPLAQHPNAPRGKWVSLPFITPAARQEHSTVHIGDTIYVIAGVPGNSSNTDPGSPSEVGTVQSYSLSDRTWRTLPPLPLAMTHPNAAAVDGKVYVLGGLSVLDGNNLVWSAVPDCFVFDPALQMWSALPPMKPEEARGSAAVGVWGGKVYLAGGMRKLELAPNGLQDSVDIVTVYDAQKGTWGTLPNLPAPRDHSGGVLREGKMYVVGGRDHGQRNVRNTTFMMELEGGKKAWKALATMPTARGGISAGTIGDYIVTFGGEGNPDTPSGVFNETEAYDVTRNQWYKLDPMAVPRHGTIATSIGSRIYIPGGGVLQGAGPVTTFDAFELC